MLLVLDLIQLGRSCRHLTTWHVKSATGLVVGVYCLPERRLQWETAFVIFASSLWAGSWVSLTHICVMLPLSPHMVHVCWQPKQKGVILVRRWQHFVGFDNLSINIFALPVTWGQKQQAGSQGTAVLWVLQRNEVGQKYGNIFKWEWFECIQLG